MKMPEQMKQSLPRTSGSSGFGLVEILVTTVVVAGGLLGLATLQGSLMSASGEEKARSQAIRLAEQSLETLRNRAALAKDCGDSVTAADFASAGIASTETDLSVAGTTTNYAVSWTVGTATTSALSRPISVTVTWDGNEQVTLDSDITLTDLCQVSLLATNGNGGAGLAPSPNNVSSNVTDERFDSADITEVALNDGSGLTTYTDSNGDIYLLEAVSEGEDGTNRKALIKFLGGVVLSISGTVYHYDGSSLSETAAYPVAFSDMAYCVFPMTGTQADYICYFGGDCNDGGTGCPQEDFDYDAVDGGWYGKIGLLETSEANFHNKKVCFAEDINGGGMETATTTARTYLTRRLNEASLVVGTDGINQPFRCQHFLVVDKQGNSYPCAEAADEPLPDTGGDLVVAASVVERDLLVGQSNEVQPVDESQCGAACSVIINGEITGNARADAQVSVNGQGCVVIASDAGNDYTYRCALETTSTSARIAASLDAENGTITPGIQTINLSNCPETELTGSTLVTSIPETGACATPWGDEVADGASVTAYQAEEVGHNSGCNEEQRVCTNGVLSGNYEFESCAVAPDSSCTSPWGATVGNGDSITAYQHDVVASDQSCDSEERTCSDGALSGSYVYETCIVSPSQCNATVSGIIVQGSDNGAKEPDKVAVTASPGGDCPRSIAGDGNHTYRCDLGEVGDGITVAIGGKKVTGGAVIVDCSDPDNDAGPTLTTTN